MKASLSVQCLVIYISRYRPQDLPVYRPPILATIYEKKPERAITKLEKSWYGPMTNS